MPTSLTLPSGDRVRCVSEKIRVNGAARDLIEIVFPGGNCVVSTDLDEAVIAIFEKQPYWGPELQRQFQSSRTIVRECRSVRDLLPSIMNFEIALIVVDLEEGLSECLEWLGSDVARHLKPVPIVVLGSPATAELEWVLREAGVTAFLPDGVAGDDLAQLCRRQLSRRHSR